MREDHATDMAAQTSNLSELTRRFRAARAWAGIEAKDAARELGTSTSTLGRIEKGIYPVPPGFVAIALLKWDVPDWLLPGDAVDLAAQADGGQHLQEASQTYSDETPDESREEPGSDAGSG